MMPLDPAALPSGPEWDVHLTENVPVPMRDGVRLATDVYRPARAGHPLGDARPVLLHRTPYNKTETEATLGQCRWLAARGYVVVTQDCRGCFRSEGEVNFLVPEAEDGADTIAWIRRQAWTNGTIGSFGTSWSGWTQTAMAALGPDAPPAFQHVLEDLSIDLSGSDYELIVRGWARHAPSAATSWRPTPVPSGVDWAPGLASVGVIAGFGSLATSIRRILPTDGTPALLMTKTR